MHRSRTLPRFARFATAPGTDPGAGAPPADDGRKGKDDGAPGWTPPASREELDRIIGDRLARERARYSDYEDLKKKAAAYDKAEDEKKTAEQRAADRLTDLEAKTAAAEARAAAAEAAALRAEIAADKGVPADFLTGTDRTDIEKRAKALLEWKNGTGPASGGLGPGARNPRANGSTAAGRSSGGLASGRSWFTERFGSRTPQSS